jgi:short-subunit dehydrogenase
MPRGGRIINIGSVISKMGKAYAAIYAAGKAAQDSLTASWAGEVITSSWPFSSNYKIATNGFGTARF